MTKKQIYMTNLSNSTQEIVFKDILGYEGFYQVSNIGGVVKSLRNSNNNTRKIPLIRVPGKHKAGYPTFILCRNAVKKNYPVHVLVLEAFVGNRPDGYNALHGDGNPLNNDLSNLRWGTSSENAQDAIRHGTFVSGERNGKAKLKDTDVVKIKLLLRNNNLMIVDIAKMFNVVPGAISNIKHGLVWNHIKI